MFHCFLIRETLTGPVTFFGIKCVFQLTRGIIIGHFYFCISSVFLVFLPCAPLVLEVVWMLR